VNVFFLALLSVTIFVTVLLRYVFEVAVPEATVVQRFAVAWLVFLGAAIALWDDQHLKIDIFGPYLSGRGKWIQRLLIDILMTGAVVLLFLAGLRAFQIGLYRTELIEIRFLKNRLTLAYINTAFLAGAGLMLLFHLLNIVDRYVLRRAHSGNERAG
jgi:TRAP-type C4-dicarboxylate transport system permease small subunit